jgi:hypothetical protein
MARNPFAKPYKSSGSKPKASTPARPKTMAAKAKGGKTGPMAQSTSAMRAPSVRVTSKASTKKSMNVGPSAGGSPMQKSGTGVANPGQWDGPGTPKS